MYLTTELPDAKDVKLKLKPAGHFNFSAKVLMTCLMSWTLNSLMLLMWRLVYLYGQNLAPGCAITHANCVVLDVCRGARLLWH
jgi:hypothetical protein